MWEIKCCLLVFNQLFRSWRFFERSTSSAVQKETSTFSYGGGDDLYVHQGGGKNEEGPVGRIIWLKVM